MTETAKERIYREALEILRGMGINSKNRVMMPYGVAVTAQEFIEEKLEDTENLPSATDKLSVEKLQEHLLPYSKEMVQKIRDEKMQLVTTDEFVKIHKESLTAIRENDKLQEQLNTAKKALTEICEFDCSDDCYFTARDALAAIGNEGSGDE